MPPLEPHAVATLLVAVVMLALLVREVVAIETTSLGVLGLLVVGFYVFPYGPEGDAFSPFRFLEGFSNPALVTIAALLVCAKGLEATGALGPVARVLATAWARRPWLAFAATLGAAAVLSMFVNNTPIVAMLLPILVGVGLRSKRSTSGILMPVGFATIVGGMCTTIGTSTNLLVTEVAAELGQPRFGLFDFFVPAAIIASAGLLFLGLVAPRLLPERKPPLPDTTPRVFGAQLAIEPGGFAEGRTVSEVLKRLERSVRIDAIERPDGVFLARLPTVRLAAGYRLHVRDTPARLKEYERRLDAKLTVSGEPATSEDIPDAAAEQQQMAELVVTPGSPLYRRTLNRTHALAGLDIIPLAIHRPGGSGPVSGNIGDQVLEAADVVLVQGSPEHLARLRQDTSMLLLDGTATLPSTGRAPLAALIMAGVVVVAAVGLVPIALTALAGAAVMLATRCLGWDQAVQSLDRRLILVIVATLALGQALTVTGATAFVAGLLVDLATGLPPPAVLAMLLIVTALITELITNSAAAVLATPIAFQLATGLGQDPGPFVLAVLFGCNMSYLTPIGYQTNMLVFSAGGYRFGDFLRVGVPLQLLLWATAAMVLPIYYGLWRPWGPGPG